MHLRSATERIFQSLVYEVAGTALVIPVYQLAFGASTGTSLLVMIAVSIACMAWCVVHNWAFDLVELRLAGRRASDRPHHLRFVHAASHEATSVVVTLPVIMWTGGHGFWEALGIDIGLTLFFTGFAYAYYLAYDWLLPVGGAVDPGLGHVAAEQSRQVFTTIIDGHGARGDLLNDHLLVLTTLHHLAALIGRAFLAETQFVRVGPRDPLASAGLSAQLTHVEGEILLHTYPARGLVVAEFRAHQGDREPPLRAVADMLHERFGTQAVEVTQLAPRHLLPLAARLWVSSGGKDKAICKNPGISPGVHFFQRMAERTS